MGFSSIAPLSQFPPPPTQQAAVQVAQALLPVLRRPPTLNKHPAPPAPFHLHINATRATTPIKFPRAGKSRMTPHPKPTIVAIGDINVDMLGRVKSWPKPGQDCLA